MQIRINGELIDFTLEKEETLGEVVSELEAWLQGTGFYIHSLQADNTLLTYEKRDQWTHTAIDDTRELSVNTVLHLEDTYNNLHITYNYIEELMQALQTDNLKYARELYEEYPSVRNFLMDILGESQTTTDYIEQFDSLENINTEQEREKFVHFLDTLKLLISERIREIESPVGELAALVTLLENTNSELQDVSVLLQTGKDREAMLMIAKFTELSQKLLRIYTILRQKPYIDVSALTVDGSDLETFYKQLNSFLTELHEAFTLNDSVLIGDLFEYEITPRIETLIAALKEVLNTYQREEV